LEDEMSIRIHGILTGAAAAAMVVVWGGSANALTMHECSAKYKAAQSGGTLKGMKWNDFRKAECGAGATTATTTKQAGAVFPTAVSPKYAKEKAGRARMHTCLEQYRANKAAGKADLKWTAKGGGYYSECNKRLSAR
jgi:hypothetical protein